MTTTGTTTAPLEQKTKADHRLPRRLIAAGHTSVVLCRTPAKLMGQLSPPGRYSNLTAVKGDAHDAAAPCLVPPSPLPTLPFMPPLPQRGGGEEEAAGRRRPILHRPQAHDHRSTRPARVRARDDHPLVFFPVFFVSVSVFVFASRSDENKKEKTAARDFSLSATLGISRAGDRGYTLCCTGWQLPVIASYVDSLEP